MNAPIKSDTPRTCPAHFGMHDLSCQDGCGEICIRQFPAQVNTVLTERTEQLAEAKVILQSNCDRDWKDETFIQTVNIAANAIYWRGRRAETAEAEVTRLNALVQRCRPYVVEHETISRVRSQLLNEIDKEIKT